ncbi:type II toxin-antitoxin system VapC family toxin [Mycobacterium sp. Y57]|uniref:type II toxin-antitoxin system VapC family toxin n=1 Tax=Mycolicibacterium xanthum TaxID=2796469 RepID=UPI001C849D47|nr:type II toxin-antitoxin system VapC family toxin [Mycolicibacterium xanthum]MBX7430575.1 type II toxin-antitoxin system VapC family toxin [Mycolicibacterium xanthum]
MSAGVFADSSALVKLYADEQDADGVRTLSPLLVSQLARVEVPAALWRKHRADEIAASHVAILVAEFEADYFGDIGTPPRFSVIAVTAGLIDAAAHLVGVHGLRAFDAVQLASALAVADAVPDGVQFLAFDRALNTAAAAEGLTAPQIPPPQPLP